MQGRRRCTVVRGAGQDLGAAGGQWVPAEGQRGRAQLMARAASEHTEREAQDTIFSLHNPS